MSFFGSKNKNPPVKIETEYFSLEDWWLSDFTEEERNYIEKTYQPMGFDGLTPLTSIISSTSQSVFGLLWQLSGWFIKTDDRKIAYRILKKAEELADNSTNIIDVHFFYMNKVIIYYKSRNVDSNALEYAIEACKQQIRIAPKVKEAFQLEYPNAPLPGHSGFKQLAIIEEKQNMFESVIELAEKALSQGWSGDWGKRIERCKKKLKTK